MASYCEDDEPEPAGGAKHNWFNFVISWFPIKKVELLMSSAVVITIGASGAWADDFTLPDLNNAGTWASATIVSRSAGALLTVPNDQRILEDLKRNNVQEAAYRGRNYIDCDQNDSEDFADCSFLEEDKYVVVTTPNGGKRKIPIREFDNQPGTITHMPTIRPDYKRSETLKIYHATSRERFSNPINQQFYGPERNADKSGAPVIEYGVFDITSTRAKTDFVDWIVAEYEEAKAWLSKFGGESPSRNLYKEWERLQISGFDPLSQNEWMRSLNEDVSIRRKEYKNALIYIPGFGNTDNEAVRSAALIAQTMDFKGVMVAFSWNANGESKNYLSALGNVDWVEAKFEKTLISFIENFKGEQIHLVCHSMGCLLLSKVLKAVLEKSKIARKKIAEVVFVAPDTDVNTTRDQYLSELDKYNLHVTIYVSKNDFAIKLSEATRNGQSMTGGDVHIFERVETIDVTGKEADPIGHSLMMSYPVMADMALLINRGLRASERHWLVEPRYKKGAGRYFKMK